LVVTPNGLTEEEILDSSDSVEQQSLPDGNQRTLVNPVPSYLTLERSFLVPQPIIETGEFFLI